MEESVKPSQECLNKIAKLQKFVSIKNEALGEAFQLVNKSQNDAKVAVERQKAAETTLSQAIQNYNADSDGGKADDFAYKLKN